MQILGKTLILASLSVFLATPVIAANTGKGATPNGKPFIELEGQIVEVEGEIASLQDQVDSIVSRVDSVEERVGANEDAILALQAKNINLQNMIDSYSSDVSAIESEVAVLIQSNQELQDLVDAGDTGLQSQIDENSALITTLNQTLADLGDLQSQIDNNLALINEMQEEIFVINNILQTKQDIVDGKCPTGYAIREINENGGVVCEYDDAGTGSGSTAAVKMDTVFIQEFIETPTYGWTHKKMWCPTGYKVMNGGFDMFKTQVRASMPYNVIGWSFTGLNENNFKNVFILNITCYKLVNQ